ncbi:MAG TPA: hypothetical protein VMV86_03845 [Methanosarcinales archaeon]|nr:hypothetical protein [Methanosarcinales archaeon]
MVKITKEKTKKFFKTVGKGAGEVGSRVAAGASSLAKKGYESYKKYNSPEAKEARLEAEEQKLIREERMSQRRSRIAKLRPKSNFGGIGGGFLGGGSNGVNSGGGFGFKPIDMSKVLGGGEPPRKRKGKGKPFDPFSQF